MSDNMIDVIFESMIRQQDLRWLATGRDRIIREVEAEKESAE